MDFVDIDGFDGKYKINKKGVIMSFVRNKNGKVMKPRVDNNGYIRINLTKNGIVSYHHIHRLLGKAFIPNPNDFPCIDHINQNKIDNRLDNLRWINHSGNNRNRYLPKKSNFPRGVERNIKSYRARIKINGKKIHLGCFRTIEEASRCYENKYIELMSEFDISNIHNRSSNSTS